MKMWTYSVMVFSIFWLYSNADTTCDPELDCQSGTVGLFVPDPADCTKYYICTDLLEPTPSSFDCAEDEHFDTASAMCVAGADCGTDSCTLTTITGSTGTVNTCSITCDEDTALIPFPGDCTKYYDCSDRENGPQTCPTSIPYFNGIGCVVEDTACCVVCQEECENPFQVVPDPSNCNGYILCDIGANNCSAGNYFNVGTLECETETTTCTPYCSDVSQSSSIGTTDPLITSDETSTDSTRTPTEDSSTETTSAIDTTDDIAITSTEGSSTETTSAIDTTEDITTVATQDSTTDSIQASSSENSSPSSQEYTCDPTTDCANGYAGLKVPDPENCSNYYFCSVSLEPTEGQSLACPTGQYFDASIYPGECIDGEDCGDDACNTQAITDNTCSTKCSDGLSLIPFPGDCSKYYRCSDPAESEGSCGEDTPYFNGIECVDDASQCCVICTPECEEDFELVPDPTNCNGYYLCGSGPNTCDPGEYFNPVSYECEAETSVCSSYCSDNTGISTTESITTTESTVTTSTTQSTSDLTTPQPTTTSSTTRLTTEAITTDLIGTCVENAECSSTDDQPYCYECVNSYYDCSTGQPVLETCTDTFVFDYTTGFCVPEEICPYFP